MKTKFLGGLLFGLCSLFLVEVGVAADANTPSQLELVRLPEFCWGQFNKSLKDPKYTIPRHACGSGMNHYCPALLALMRSHAPGLSRSKRIGQLEKAKRGTEYTLANMKSYPSCPLRSHAEATLLNVNAQLLGAK